MIHSMIQCLIIIRHFLRNATIDYNNSDRYRAVNFCSYLAHNTIEFRIFPSGYATQLNKYLDFTYNFVNEWIKTHTIDPLRRIKHRAINLFGPLSTDIQYLLELWNRKKFIRARKHIEEIRKGFEKVRYPTSLLTRLWYMLVGKYLNCRDFEIPDDISLPKHRELSEEEREF